MSAAAAPGGRSGPRQPPRRRAGAGPRSPAPPRRSGRAISGTRALREATPSPVGGRATTAAAAEPGDASTAATRDARGELSGLRLLLAQFDELLRDPTLARALRSFAARLAAAAASIVSTIAAAIRQLARLRLRLPSRLLLALLALALPLALLALMTPGDDEPATPTAERQQVPSAGAGATLPAAAMPDLRAAQRKPEAVRVALVLDRSYDKRALRRELSALGAWLAEHHSAGTRLTIIDPQSARASAPLRPTELDGARPLQARSSTTAAIRAALGRPQNRRLLVALGAPAPRLRSGSTLSIATRRGASPAAPPLLGRRSRVEIDDRRPSALAASVARAIMSVSGQRERR